MIKRGILTRYILKETLQYFLGALFAFTAMLLALNLLRLASLIINKGVDAAQIGMVFVALVPTFLEIAIPMSALLGVMLAFARLSGDSEIVVMKASGISVARLARPILVFGVLVTFLSLFVSLVARPWGYDNLSKALLSIASRSTTAGLDEGVFSKLGMMTIYTGKINHHDGVLEHVLLDDRRDKETRKIVFARTGSISSDPESGRTVFYLKDGEIHEILAGKYSVTRFKSNATILEPEDLFDSEAAKRGKQLSAMSLDELDVMGAAYKDLLRRIESGETKPEDEIELPLGQELSPTQVNVRELSKRVNRARIEAGRRFSMPYAAFVLALVGLTLGVQPARTQRTWGIGLSAVFGLGVFVLYYGFLSIGIALSEGGTMHPFVALWLPNVVVTGVAALTLWKVGTEKWGSVAQAFEPLVDWISSKVRR